MRNFFIEKISPPSVKLDTPKYKPYGAFEWKFPEGAKKRWTKPLGKNLCIFDLDSRPFDEPGQIFGRKVLTWEKPEEIHGLSLGVLQHWLFAKIHGYKYYYVKTGDFQDRRASWKKPFIIRKMLEKHETCVYMDSDAIFNHMDLPVEWLLNYWDIDAKKDLVSLSIDPKAEHNRDKKGKLYDNTGFVIAQNHPVTFNMMDDWAVCADDGGKHPDCVDYRTVAFGRPSDQGGFGNFIRYDYKDSVKELPCSEANGFPEDRSECVGTFVKHLWSGKSDLIKIAIGQQIPGAFLEAFHRQILAEKDEFYWTEDELNSEKWENAPSWLGADQKKSS
ncbi:hypothetical protein SODALDRAFT_336204 [Sodiomyces alkalinus F11]|uniref:Nucleotide-diphospho-sugar transferase domain-containing protein n=1 Tax=Sodiomyces alkalinus (strain CBS 110278 / VKM F-3762 / F11) TaxID=1314773 RepID=A0A3N2Q6S1_SODAK|nr:hypothetical protein SODALDRAFT_336204 [Sodiomyces alkalinus F11]ROT42489.1 hypothetical protein SODALDRAFT_336204 [Sodiomyces alkalinus F11]